MTQRSAGYRSVFAVAEFRWLWVAQVQSVVGDQLARIALSVLVFERTGSPAWTALTYAMTILPNLAGGALLSGLADRFDRRAVMVAADASRAAVVAVMALPGEPIAVLVVLLCVVQLGYAPFSAARNAILPAILSDDRYLVGVAIARTTDQLGMVAGFAGGAAVVTVLGTRQSLLLDAATFAVSVALVALGVRSHRPPAGTVTGPALTWRPWWTSLRAGLGLVVGDVRLRALVGLACVNGFYVIPEGLAVPYTAQIRAGTTAVGWLLAAIPAGAVVGMVVLKAVRPDWRLRLLGPMAVATCVVLLPVGWAPTLAVSLVLWIATGLFSAHDMITHATFVRLVPDARRGQALGLAGAAMQGAQGIGIVLAGLVAQWLSPATVIASAAGAGAVAAALAATAWARAASRESAPVMGKPTA
ncbi:MAG TPA: MFS transporter [Pseudonocardiaceae bacterium]|jgi:MFS family permease|nr:MFS transporter [Pseudonocardiaceae bacterium]